MENVSIGNLIIKGGLRNFTLTKLMAFVYKPKGLALEYFVVAN